LTAVEAYELVTRGGATDFGRLIHACELFGCNCIIGDIAVNCYTEPVYTLDVEIVVSTEPYLGNAQPPASDLRVQFTTDPRYQPFPSRAVEAEVLGVRARIASLRDVTQGKLWAYSDAHRRLSKRKKDELDLIRLAEAHPELKLMYPDELREQIERG